MKTSFVVLVARKDLRAALRPGNGTKYLKFIANDPGTPGWALTVLAHCRPLAIVERVAENNHTPTDVLDNLSEHPCSDVRIAVAANMVVSQATLWRLIQDESIGVRYSIAENGNSPTAVLEHLIEDENSHVMMRALNTLRRLRNETNLLLPWFVQTNPNRRTG